jgi:hypothetical protein
MLSIWLTVRADACLAARGQSIWRPKLQAATSSDARTSVPISTVLQRLHDEVPADHFTLSWLMSSLRKRSFGIIMLLLGLAATVPGVSVAAGLLLMIPACQLILGHTTPAFPRRIANHPIPTRHLAALVQRAVPVLRYLEKAIHPRWHPALDAAGRLVGVVVLALSAALVFIPIPTSNIVPALTIVLISLAWLEEDGLLLAIAIISGVVVSMLALAAVWATVRGAEWISRFW